MTQNNSSTSTQAWENYWHGSQLAGTVGTGGAQDPVFKQFWTEYFERQLETGASIALLDIGCGSGALIEFAQTVAQLKSANPAISAVDASASATAYIEQHYPTVTAVCADAASIPLAAQSFDLIVSQFGLEYAGTGAALEAARLLRPGGTFTALLHLKEGAVDRECAADKRALTTVLDSGLFPALIHLFRESLALRKGEGSRVGFELADRGLNPPVQIVRSVLSEHGETLANGLLHRIYADIAHMYKNMKAYDPDEVIAWSEKVEAELQAFAHRLASMNNAALDESALDGYITVFKEHGLLVDSPEVLKLGEGKEPGAWILHGHKKPA